MVIGEEWNEKNESKRWTQGCQIWIAASSEFVMIVT